MTLADKIVEYIFTNGNGDKATIIRLMNGDRYLGGYIRPALRRAIQEIIDEHAKAGVAEDVGKGEAGKDEG